MSEAKFLTVEQTAKLIGKNPFTLYRWIKAGKLKTTKVGRTNLISKEQLAAVYKLPEWPSETEA